MDADGGSDNGRIVLYRPGRAGRMVRRSAFVRSKCHASGRRACTGDFPDIPTRLHAIHTLLQQVLESHTLP